MATPCTSEAQIPSQFLEATPSLTHQWELDAACFDPEIDDEVDVGDAIRNLEKEQLARSTSLYMLCAVPCDVNAEPRRFSAQDSTLGDNQAVAWLSATQKRNPDGIELLESQRLQITSKTFNCLVSALGVPVAFVAAISRPYLVCGTGLRQGLPGGAWDYWSLLPVRVALTCNIEAKDHAKSRAGGNQMDPFHYIHLSGTRADIRGSQIGLFVRGNEGNDGRGMKIIVVNLLDRRLQSFIEGPLLRLRRSVERTLAAGRIITPRLVFLVYVSSVLRWWNAALLSFNQQLVIHEKHLQREIADETSAFSEVSKDINTALHTMAAHLHRYKSELQRIDLILTELLSFQFDTQQAASDNHVQHVAITEADKLKTERLLSQLHAMVIFVTEMERKIQNILALLFNQIQVTNDKTLQAILRAAQADAKLSQRIAQQSHDLTVRMRDDSIAMKTIAVLTMTFLPATSFAAILSMPFFTQSTYLTLPSTAWIWAILTSAFTTVAFLVFRHVTKQQRAWADADESGDQVGSRPDGQSNGQATNEASGV
ncbi:hypothetical protein B0H63DRAFT_180382 [Podospora didyma]|uniref:Uncharacterized protein n=1 Tax=Podospora didyma TaxID=330526 RepID=A0AAE0NPA8_9PEZI|nr:hypothetical protein B0H63DRAFT_180382 [Podospora didyma]